MGIRDPAPVITRPAGDSTKTAGGLFSYGLHLPLNPVNGAGAQPYQLSGP